MVHKALFGPGFLLLLSRAFHGLLIYPMAPACSGCLETEADQAVVQASDMPTILETASQMPKDWNPAGRSWLPPEMTRQPTVPERGTMLSLQRAVPCMSARVTCSGPQVGTGNDACGWDWCLIRCYTVRQLPCVPSPFGGAVVAG